jgi:hypothetical protein
MKFIARSNTERSSPFPLLYKSASSIMALAAFELGRLNPCAQTIQALEKSGKSDWRKLIYNQARSVNVRAMLDIIAA